MLEEEQYQCIALHRHFLGIKLFDKGAAGVIEIATEMGRRTEIALPHLCRELRHSTQSHFYDDVADDVAPRIQRDVFATEQLQHVIGPRQRGLTLVGHQAQTVHADIGSPRELQITTQAQEITDESCHHLAPAIRGIMPILLAQAVDTPYQRGCVPDPFGGTEAACELAAPDGAIEIAKNQ